MVFDFFFRILETLHEIIYGVKDIISKTIMISRYYIQGHAFEICDIGFKCLHVVLTEKSHSRIEKKTIF